MFVAGLDLARRRDHSALVLLDVEPDRLTVSAALRLPQAPLRQQFTLIAPHLAGLDLLVFDQSGLGDAAAELLPKTPPHIGICLTGGDRPLTRSAQGDRLVVGKSWLIQRLGAAMRSGALTVAEHAPGRDLLRRELAQFVFKPGARGRMRLEAARGHDDLVIATALALLAAGCELPS
jgi:phage FluMu gp28-like protein